MMRFPRRAPTSIPVLLGGIAGVYGFLFVVHVVNATDHSYTAGAGGIVVTVAPDAATNYASLAHAKTGHAWAAGETITLAPGTYLANTNGGSTFTFGAGKSGANYSRLVGNGATITFNSSTINTAVLEINTSGVQVLDVTLNNVGASGGVLRLNGSTNAISDIYLYRVTVNQSTAAAAANPSGPISLPCVGTAGAVSAFFEEVVCEFPFVGTNGTRDTFGYGDGTTPYSLVTGHVVLKNCRFGGATKYISDVAVSLDGNALIEIRGGVYHDTGGNIVEPVLSQPRFGRIIADGAEFYGAGNATHTSGGSPSTPEGYAFVGQGISNSYIHGCSGGAYLYPGETSADAQTNATANVSGTCWAQNNVIIRKAPAGEVGADIIGFTFGIKQAGPAKNVIISGNYIDGVNPLCNSSNSLFVEGVSICNTNHTFASLDHNFIKNCYRGVSSAGYGNIAVELDSNVVIGSPADAASSVPQMGSFYLKGASAAAPIYIGATNNLTNWTPTGTTKIGFYWLNGVLDGRSGYNYLYIGSPDATSQGSEWTTYGYFPQTGWPATDLGTSGSIAPPSLDAWGVPVAGTAAASWGAYDPDALTPYNTNGRFALGTVDATTATNNANTNAFETDIASNGSTSDYTYSTLLFPPNDANTASDAANDGCWRVITAEANTNGHKRFTVQPPFPAIPTHAKKFVILPPAYPRVGKMSSYYPQHVEILPTGGPLSRRQDAFSRFSQPAFVAVSGTPASFARGNVGWMNTTTRWPELYRRIVGVPLPGRPANERPSNRRP